MAATQKTKTARTTTEEYLKLHDENMVLMNMLTEYFDELRSIAPGQCIDWGHVGNMGFFKEHLLEMLKFSRCLADEDEALAEIEQEMNQRLHAAGMIQEGE